MINLHALRGIAASRHTMFYNVSLVFFGSLFIALGAQVSTPSLSWVAPFTMQTYAVLLVGAVLGPERGAWAVMLYLAEGALGAPVFAGMKAGAPVLFSPRGGYLFGMIFAAALAGIAYRHKASFAKNYLLLLFATAPIFLVGLFHLQRYVPSEHLLAVGLYPYILADVIKVALVLSSLKLANSFKWKP